MSISTEEFAKFRKDFPMLAQQVHGKPFIYLDSAVTAQKPQSVIDAITHFYQNQYATVHRAIYHFSVNATQAYEEVRVKAQKLLNAAHPEEIIFTRGTTEGINLVASSFGKTFIQPGDEIIITEMEHHSNIVPWQILCIERQANLKVVPINDRGELNMSAYAKLLSNKTKLVAVAHMANSTGTINPIQKMIDMAHEYDAKVLIDAAQSVPHMPVDVRALDADFLAFSGHKFYGPTGIGVLYGKKELLQEMHPYQSGGDMISKVNFDATTYNELPLKFEAGTPMIAEVLGLGAAIDYVQAIGLKNIHKMENELLLYALDRMKDIKEINYVGTADNRGAIISFTVKGIHPLDIGTMLDLRGIALRTGQHCAQPTMQHFNVPATCRISFAFYNTKSEIDTFVVALQEVIRILS